MAAIWAVVHSRPTRDPESWVPRYGRVSALPVVQRAFSVDPTLGHRDRFERGLDARPATLSSALYPPCYLVWVWYGPRRTFTWSMYVLLSMIAAQVSVNNLSVS